LAQALIALGRSAEAEALLAEQTAAADTDDQRAQLALVRVGNLCWGVGDPAQATAVMRAVQAAPWTDPERLELQTLRAALLLHDGRFAEALDVIGPLAAGSRQPGPVVVAAQAVAADVLCGIGANDAALAMADRARAAAADVGGAAADWANVQLDSAKCGAFISLGLLDDAEALAATGYRDAIGADRPVAQALFGGWSGIVLAQRGLVRSGLGRLRDATAALPPGAFSFLPVLHAQTAQAAALLGDLDTAGAALIQAEHALTGAGEACAPWVRLAAAWIEAVTGRNRAAVVTATEAAARARDYGQVQLEMIALHTCVRFGAAPEVLDRLVAVAADVDGPLAAAVARQATALAHDDAHGLDEVAAGFAALGSTLLAAEAAAQATRQHSAHGNARAAAMAATRSRGWAAACEGARTPPLAEPGASAPLTPRELEIAALAASGMTSKAIGENLVVSVRTVDNVLHGIYRKLHVSGRRDLPTVIGSL
ncbi:LuxR C-terminal-related transcriptional regulator, partial [Pseudonocardia sp.]|uniref:helix-turn-helix transcriptional regulator n=1 Tax=Pseudonocardia sp. TaxID=60912 RepID=UPI002624F11D